MKLDLLTKKQTEKLVEERTIEWYIKLRESISMQEKEILMLKNELFALMQEVKDLQNSMIAIEKEQ